VRVRRGNDFDSFDLERQLRSSRPQPRDAYVRWLAGVVGSSARPAHDARRRGGFAIALTGLMIVAVASFGGVGYAASAVSDVVNKVKTVTAAQAPTSASSAQAPASVRAPTSAQAQYGTFTPATTPPRPAPVVKGGGKTKPKGSGGQSTGKSTGKGIGKGARGGAAGAQASAGGTSARQGGTAQGAASSLPFTGLALWIPIAIGTLLIAAGLILRSRGRRPGAAA
jgi:hypothetical protein